MLKNNLAEKRAWRGFCKGFVLFCFVLFFFVHLRKILNGHKTFASWKIDKLKKSFTSLKFLFQDLFDFFKIKFLMIDWVPSALYNFLKTYA